MRPLKLTMTAFGPYKDTETIDFSELRDHRLFVISGNTGAGKTTIFDAISYALYGDASGEDRSDSKMLRSHFADEETHTSVDFTFELKGRIYRVFRQMAHTKAGRKTATGDRYELYEIKGGKEIPLTDRFIVSKVDEKIRELIGLTKDQFSQIVMLPQGEFRKLLTSETENKEEILRRIFKTGLYKLVADRLNEKRREMQQLCAELAAIRDTYIQQAKASFGVREGSALAGVFAQEQYNTYQVLEALEQEIQHYQERMLENKVRLKAEHEQYQAQTALYHQAKGINEQFAALEQKKAELERLEGQAEEFERKRAQLKLAEQAVQLEVYERHDAEAAEEALRKSERYEAAVSSYAQAEAALQQAAEQHEREKQREGEREQALRELDRLQGLLPTVKELDQKEQLTAQLAAETESLAKQLAAVQGELAAQEAERAKLAGDVKALEEQVHRLPEVTEQLSLMREQARLLQEVLALRQKAMAEREEARRRQAAFEAAEQALAALEERWMEGQAALLAAHLHDGEACPVCGSTSHPRKASALEAIPSREELDRLRKQKSAAEQAYAEAKAKRETVEQQLAEREQQVQAQGFLGERLQEDFDALVQEGKALAAEEKRLKEAHGKLASAREQLEQLDWRLEALRRRKEVLQAKLAEKQAALAAEQALRTQALAALPEEARSLEQLEWRIREAEARKQQLEEAWRAALEQFQAAKERSIRLASEREHAEAQQNEAAQQAEKARQHFLQALTQAGFASVEAYRAAKMSEAARAELKRSIEDYTLALNSVSKGIEELEQALAGKERQDLAALEQSLAQAELRLDALRSAYMQAESLHEQGVEIKTNIEKAQQKWSSAEEEYQRIRDLYDTVRGENALKLSFERYLQIEFLEQIIHAANQRLRRLSGGQFYLVRSGRMEKRGKQSGLGLDVFDNYTGQLRDVKTLSGGEKFNASLCLALGLADVIQSYEGGISLETMFIDEGFGSLDEESLHKAIDTLIDLQQSGRMIGVISHVQELKQAIPAVLEVKKTKEGYSYTQFRVS